MQEMGRKKAASERRFDKAARKFIRPPTSGWGRIREKTPRGKALGYDVLFFFYFAVMLTKTYPNAEKWEERRQRAREDSTRNFNNIHLTSHLQDWWKMGVRSHPILQIGG